MCGIFGCFDSPDQGIMWGLCMANSSRGKQSAGVAVYNGKETVITKKAIDPFEFVFTDFPDVTGSKIVIGHTRFPTRGAVTDENAHPYASPCGRFIYVHNGMISNDYEIQPGLAVDSMAIGVLLTKYKGNMKKVCNDLTGSAAIAVIDTQKGSLQLIAHHNPIHTVKVGDKVYFSSQDDHLALVFRSAGYVVSQQHIGGLIEDTLYTISENGEIQTSEAVEFKAYAFTPSTDWEKRQADNDMPITTYPKNNKKKQKKSKEERKSEDWELSFEYMGCIGCQKVPLDRGYYDENSQDAFCTECARKKGRNTCGTFHWQGEDNVRD